MSQEAINVLNNISQAASSLFDGAVDKDGKPLKMGFRREVDDPTLQSRGMDGARFKIHGDKLIVSYMTEIKLDDIYKGGPGSFENEMRDMLKSAVKGLKKKYNEVAGSALSLSEPTEPKVVVEKSSNVRAWATASCSYTIKTLSSKLLPTGEEDIKKERKVKTDFISLGGWGKTQPGEKNKKPKEKKSDKP